MKYRGQADRRSRAKRGRREARHARHRAGSALQRAGDPHFAAAANAHELLARVELAERHPVPLARHAAALRAIGQHTGNDRLRATASWADGAAAALNGQPEEARNLALTAARGHASLACGQDEGE